MHIRTIRRCESGAEQGPGAHASLLAFDLNNSPHR